jgi:5-methylcytosine-specific restriction endonuclease McrA
MSTCLFSFADSSHIIPVAKQGSNQPENLMALCHDCHKKVHAKARLTKHRDQTELDLE